MYGEVKGKLKLRLFCAFLKEILPAPGALMCREPEIL
jgi:hypothetical protein